MERNETEEDVDPLSGSLDIPERTLRALSNPLVRYTLRFIDTHPEATIDEVTDAVAGFEAANTDTIVTSHTRDRIRVQLYHTVLPQLDDLGLLRFDTADKTVERAEIPRSIAPVLDLVE